MYTHITTAYLRQFMVACFSAMFFVFAVILAGLAIQNLISGFTGSDNLIGTFVNGVNTAVISLAIFELGLVVSKEYGSHAENHIVVVLRRTVPRFISIVCIALALEGLLLVVKYSQLELAGNLYYPVAIIIAASLLLTALGVFLRFTNYPVEESLPATQDLAAPQEVHASCVPAERFG